MVFAVLVDRSGVWSSSNNVPHDVSTVGCKTLANGSIFRLLGIPMVFGISIKERWGWVLDKFRLKLKRWQGYQPNFFARLFVLNHFLLPSTIFF